MSSCRERALVFAAVLAVTGTVQSAPAPITASVPQDRYPGIGRAATPKELAAWDIDVRPDFKGLPRGAGSVARGQVVWEAQCASCHGVFGENNEVFAPIVGGTTKDDIRTGHAARLNDRGFPGRTTLMKLSTVSTLWDYIRRAMPWNAPKSLSTEEVYGVTAYLLNLGGIVPDDFTLSDRNIADVQKLLPNRNGMTAEHALWPGPGFGKRQPPVRATACMKDCSAAPVVTSAFPDFARNAHGNLAEQNRGIGAQRGADTSRPAPLTLPMSVPATATAVATTPAAAIMNAVAAGPAPPAAPSALALTEKNGCVACHGLENKVLGPAFREIGQRYAGRADAADHLAGKIKLGGAGTWGAIPMPAQALPDADAKAIARWLAEGAK